MAKSPSGLELRTGTSICIGDNRYGMREAYDPAVDTATKEYYRKGDKQVIKEITTITQSVKVVKP